MRNIEASEHYSVFFTHRYQLEGLIHSFNIYSLNLHLFFFVQNNKEIQIKICYFCFSGGF